MGAATARSIPVDDPQSTLTDRYQTTIPEAVRKSLRLKKGDRVSYQYMREGEFLIRKAATTEGVDDPALQPFLSFLANDIQQNPARLRGIDKDLIARARALTAGVIIDRDSALHPEDE